MARGRDYYIIDLENPHEEIKMVRGYPGHGYAGIGRWRHPAILLRYGKPKQGFLLSEKQVQKVRTGRGKIKITSKQVDDYLLYSSKT